MDGLNPTPLGTWKCRPALVRRGSGDRGYREHRWRLRRTPKHPRFAHAVSASVAAFPASPLQALSRPLGKPPPPRATRHPPAHLVLPPGPRPQFFNSNSGARHPVCFCCCSPTFAATVHSRRCGPPFPRFHPSLRSIAPSSVLLLLAEVPRPARRAVYPLLPSAFQRPSLPPPAYTDSGPAPRP